MGYKITSVKKNIVAISGTNNDVDFHNQLFETDDCVIEYFEDPTPEELEQAHIEAEANRILGQQKQVILDQLKEIDSKSIRALRAGETQYKEDAEILIKNAKACGYKDEEIEIIDMTAEEYNKVIKIQDENELLYQEKRKREYPPQEDFLDAKAKQGSSDENIKQEGIKQEQDYINKCLAVKTKYPKV